MMESADENGSAAKSDWVAVTRTAIKASAADSSTLSEHEKIFVAKDTRLTALIDGDAEEHWTIADAVSDDTPLPEGLRFIYKGHWELQPTPMAEVPALEELTLPPKAENEAAMPMGAGSVPAVPPGPASRNGTLPFYPPAEPDPPKSVNHRRLFGLFRRNLGKAR